MALMPISERNPISTPNPQLKSRVKTGQRLQSSDGSVNASTISFSYGDATFCESSDDSASWVSWLKLAKRKAPEGAVALGVEYPLLPVTEKVLRSTGDYFAGFLVSIEADAELEVVDCLDCEVFRGGLIARPDVGFQNLTIWHCCPNMDEDCRCLVYRDFLQGVPYTCEPASLEVEACVVVLVALIAFEFYLCHNN